MCAETVAKLIDMENAAAKEMPMKADELMKLAETSVRLLGEVAIAKLDAQIAETEKAEMSVKALEAKIDAARAAWKPLPYEDESGVVRLTLGDAATIMVMLGVDRQNPTGLRSPRFGGDKQDPVVGHFNNKEEI